MCQLPDVYDFAGIHNIHYSRDETISAVRQFYTFLSKMYMDESDILEPPEGGWPHMDNLRCMGKTDEVIELLRRLPYLCPKGPEGKVGLWPSVAPRSDVINWSELAPKAMPCSSSSRRFDGWNGNNLRHISEPMELMNEDRIPPDVIGLVYSAGRYRKNFLLDTARGIIHWYECWGEIQILSAYYTPPPTRLDFPEEWAPENEVEWRSEYPAWSVTDFFAIIRRQFEDLNFVPLGPHNVQEVFTMADDNRAVIKAVQDIYRQHGWPDLATYRKEDCLRAVRKAMREDFPESIRCGQEGDYVD
ncbi:hypothetical protein PG999_000059 [Apiospora kogelbergensis]|uniref:Uncharacterized protein n=1 Tax=Apiospora kogelbergensis TaxID=1337665 RepID=A0AAW0RAT7_9PEZI